MSDEKSEGNEGNEGNEGEDTEGCFEGGQKCLYISIIPFIYSIDILYILHILHSTFFCILEFANPTFYVATCCTRSLLSLLLMHASQHHLIFLRGIASGTAISVFSCLFDQTLPS